MQLFGWEDRLQEVPFWVHMVAGSLAGISEHLSVYPLDNLKTHCQAGSRLSSWKIMSKIYECGGLSNFYSGSFVLAVGCIPAHAIYFSIYEQSKRLLIDKHSWFASYGIIGALSSLFHDLIMTPTEVVKQRLQLMGSQNSRSSILFLLSSMYKNQGLIAFYRSFGINFLMNIPFNSTLIIINEKLKQIFAVKQNEHKFMYYLCGGLAGALASIPTCPFDVIKTKLNTQNCFNFKCQKHDICSLGKPKVEPKANITKMTVSLNRKIYKPSIQVGFSQSEDRVKYHNIFDTARTIMNEEGLEGFFKGVKVRTMIQGLSSAVAWGTYQSIKNLLQPSGH